MRAVALKILSPKYASRPKFVDQFIREARAAGALNHPNIIQVHDVATENDINYFSMEFVDGSTCMQILRADGPFPQGEALEICRQVARALEYAHQHRLIHQDIKPDNIMIGPGNLVKLADLGISKTFDEAANEVEGKKVMGTPHYMAPEAALGKKIDHRVDIYSLGATLYHLLTGKTPYHGTSATEVLKAHVMDPLPPLQDLNPEVSDDVCSLVERMMAKTPEERYQTATEVVQEIERLQGGSSLGRERIPGHETMILRRFASGKVASPPGTVAGAPTTGDHTPDALTAVAAPGWTSMLGWMLGIAAIILIGLAAWMIGSSNTNPATTHPTTPPIAPPSSGQTQTPSRPIATTPDPAAEVDSRDAQQISALSSRIRSDASANDLRDLSALVSELAVRPLSAGNRKSVDSLRSKLEEAMRQRRIEQERSAFNDLEVEVTRLTQERNWNVALGRIDAFKPKEDQLLVSRCQGLRKDIEDDRKAFQVLIDERIKSAQSLKSPLRLRELRDGLPKALLGSEIETRLSSLIAEMEEGQRAVLAKEVGEAALDLAKWDFAKVLERHGRIRAGLGDSAPGRLLDDYANAARRLPQMIAAMDAALVADGLVRYRGTLFGWQDPDIEHASLKSLTFIASSGGHIDAPWAKFSPADIITVGQLVLKDAFEPYRASVNVLAQVKVGTEK